MSTGDVTTQEILNAIQLVPTERWGDVLQAIESLQPQSAASAPSVQTGADLRGSDLIGIWADRTDLGNAREFARRLRHDAQQRNRQGRTDATGY
jgi:hypothetical protein